MFDFSSVINLPFIFACVIALAVFMYVFLDGFDLGVGILFPFAPTDKCRDKMMNSIGPFWDGNETWLVLGGGGLFAAFPLAYSIILPAVYLPVIMMLFALILRGISFEFRFKASFRGQKLWDYCFHFGSLFAALMQGIILGSFIQGFKVVDNKYAGGAFEWLNAFSLTVGVALVFGYALLGSTWLVMKTEQETQAWAQKCSLYLVLYVVLFMGIVSLWVPFIDEAIFNRWFSWPNVIYLLPLPISAAISAFVLIQSVKTGREVMPFIMAILLFAFSYLGLGISLWPWAIPFSISIDQAAACSETLSLEFIGVAIMLPIILAYTVYGYYIFRGKVEAHESY